MKERLVPPEAIVPLPATVNTIGELRDYMGFDALQAQDPEHDLFIVVYKAPGNPFAFLMRMRKDVAHIQNRWPIEVDPETRVVVINPVPAVERRAA